MNGDSFTVPDYINLGNDIALQWYIAKQQADQPTIPIPTVPVMTGQQQTTLLILGAVVIGAIFLLRK